jgi:hypothetical protein
MMRGIKRLHSGWWMNFGFSWGEDGRGLFRRQMPLDLARVVRSECLGRDGAAKIG